MVSTASEEFEVLVDLNNYFHINQGGALLCYSEQVYAVVLVRLIDPEGYSTLFISF